MNFNLRLHSFPTRRSSDLDAPATATSLAPMHCLKKVGNLIQLIEANNLTNLAGLENLTSAPSLRISGLDRKSTRLNSSHPSISYAVFCLKKKINVFSATHS